MIRDIVVNLPLRNDGDTTTPFSVSVAKLFEAHLTGVAFLYEPVIPPEVGVSLPVAFIEEQRIEIKKNAAAAVARFEAAAKREGSRHGFSNMTASAAHAAKRFSEMARRFDLIVVAQSRPEEMSMDDLFIEAALFESGRPTLIVPYTQRAPLKLDRVTICWDGSRPAARAVADAMPLLKRAGKVDIFIAEGERAKSEDFAGADIAQHLARHDINVAIDRTMMTIDIGSTILNFAADRGSDLLVMGGYGHSRLREFILGGATHEILKSMTVPTLMSH